MLPDTTIRPNITSVAMTKAIPPIHTYLKMMSLLDSMYTKAATAPVAVADIA